MKKTLFFALCLAVLMAAVGCNKEPFPGKQADQKISVMVSITGSPNSRATNTKYADESKVNSLQIFVFNGDDREAYQPVTNSMSALVPATAGERTVWAVVNAPDLSAIMSKATLESTVSNLSYNTRSSFVMTGAVTQELSDGGNVPITVRRIVARASIAKISSNFRDYRENYSFKVEGLYLINVAADSKYQVGGEPGSWVNKLGHVDAAMDALLFDALTDVTVKNNSPYEVEHAFYPYPNIYPAEGTTQDFADNWNPRGTILVIEGTMYEGDGTTVVKHGYYPIALPAIERNKTYIIEEVCLTRLPGDVPYKPIETGETQVTITPHDWELGLNLGKVTI